MASTTGYTCRRCGRRHDDAPLSYRTKAPEYWAPHLDRDPDSELSADLCIIRREHFFVQANIEILILDSYDVFAWGVWVSLSEPNFARTCELWEQEGRESEPPYFGWLATELPIYHPSVLNLRTQVHTREVGRKPLVEIEPTDHPLALEQRTGITMARVQEIAELVLHT